MTWIIGSGHLERVEAYERERAAKTPVVVAAPAASPIERQASHNGATWLDREMLAETPVE